jgi:hypothetical protein
VAHNVVNPMALELEVANEANEMIRQRLEERTIYGQEFIVSHLSIE